MNRVLDTCIRLYETMGRNRHSAELMHRQAYKPAWNERPTMQNMIPRRCFIPDDFIVPNDDRVRGGI